MIKERADGGHERDGREGGKARQRKMEERKRRREEEGGKERSSRSWGLPVTDSGSDNAFIMGKGEQRKGLIHRRVRES